MALEGMLYSRWETSPAKLIDAEKADNRSKPTHTRKQFIGKRSQGRVIDAAYFNSAFISDASLRMPSEILSDESRASIFLVVDLMEASVMVVRPFLLIPF